MQLFFYLFGPWIIPLWRRGSGTTDPALAYSVNVSNEWCVEFVCYLNPKIAARWLNCTANTPSTNSTLLTIGKTKSK